MTIVGKTEEDIDQKGMALFNDFLNGKLAIGEGESTVDINFLTTPKGEPDRQYRAKYALFDLDGDSFPELHIQTARYYYVLKAENDHLYVWAILSPYDALLNNGAFLYHRSGGAPNHESYIYRILNYDGNEAFRVSFDVYDSNQDGMYNDVDRYSFDGVEVMQEQWEGLTSYYLSIGSDRIDWVVLFEETT